MTNVKTVPASIDKITTVPNVWRAEKFTSAGYQFAAALKSGRHVHLRDPNLHKPVEDMDAVIKSAKLQVLDERAAQLKRIELDTTLTFRYQVSDFLSRLFTARVVDYSEVLQELYGCFTTGKGIDEREHNVSLEADGRFTWKETYPRAINVQAAPYALDWIEFALVPGDSRVFRQQTAQGLPGSNRAEIIGCNDVANRLSRYMSMILKAETK